MNQLLEVTGVVVGLPFLPAPDRRQGQLPFQQPFKRHCNEKSNFVYHNLGNRDARRVLHRL
jgi:hypothetical protein